MERNDGLRVFPLDPPRAGVYRRLLAIGAGLALGLVAMMTVPGDARAEAQGMGGKWKPDQLLDHDPKWLEELGLELPPEELWKPGKGGLLEAVVQLNGCSAGFVSRDGLMLTNHHCIFSILQEHSSPERDFIEEGFLAERWDEELPGSAARASIPHRFRDVTEEILAAVPPQADDLTRYRAIEQKKKELVQTCETRPHRRCRVAVYDDGVLFELVEVLEFRDVRLVWAPPRAVGEYGGEIDNWSWPRHCGDFALVRVYADSQNRPADPDAENRPYRPAKHLKIAAKGVERGDFVMVAGYPGSTQRSLLAEEMAERIEHYHPRRTELYSAWRGLMEDASAGDPEAAILLAGRIKGLANRQKNSRGQVEAVARGGLLEKKRALEEAVIRWTLESGEHRGAIAAQKELSLAIRDRVEGTWPRDFLFAQSASGSLSLALAIDLVRWSKERRKDDEERRPGYQDRDQGRLVGRIQLAQRRLHAPTEAQLLADYLSRFLALPPELQPPSIAALVEAGEGIEAVTARLLEKTSIHSLDYRLAALDRSLDELLSAEDSLLPFVAAFVDDLEVVEEEQDRRAGAALRLRPIWRRAQEAFAKRPLDPDANGTLRLSLARVEGYRPRDGIRMEPVTSLGGVVEKHRGEEPFAAPAGVLEAAGKGPGSRWASAGIGDVPVAFLATGDTTGGNSGSPMLNGRGELVGVNFDRVWENIANDFAYDPKVARNISADLRYLLFLLEEVEGKRAEGLLRELGIAPQRGASEEGDG